MRQAAYISVMATTGMLARLYSLHEAHALDEMARSREEAMWTVLDWAATQPGTFTINDMYREWKKAGGGGDSASIQQFSTAINNYIYKFDPSSPVEKYRNPRYKFIRVGKTDKGNVPAPLEFVQKGRPGKGSPSVLQWRRGLGPMRQPAAPKAPLAPDDSPVGDVLDDLEKKVGRPALKAAMQRWKQLGNLHKISADIMADPMFRGKNKMLALQVAADTLVSSGKATQKQADDAEEDMEDSVPASGDRTPFSSQAEPDDGANEFDDDEKTDPDAKPLGSQQDQQTGDEDYPDDLLHGDDEPPSAPSDSEEEPEGAAEPERTEPEQSADDGTMRGFLVHGENGKRIPVTIEGDDEEGYTVKDARDESYGPYEGYNLEVANGVLTQDAFDDLEEDGWNLVAAEESQADDSEEDSEDGGGDDDEGDEEDGSDDESEPDDRQGSTRAASDDSGDVGDPEEGTFPSFVPEPDEEGDKYQRAMFELVSEGDYREDSPLWGQLRKAKDSIDAHRIIKTSGIPPGLHKYALTVARAIFTNTGRDFDTGKKNESRLASLYGIRESPLVDPVDFDQKNGLERLWSWAGRTGRSGTR